MPGEWETRIVRRRPSSGRTVEDLRCSFCGKRRDTVKGFVAGPTPAIAICDECVALCAEILSESGPPDVP